MTRRNRRPRFNGSDDDHAATELLASIRPAPEDGTTWAGANDIGVMVIEVAGPAPLAGYRPAPASFPALQAAPEPGRRPVLAPVPVTEAAVIGDELRLPVIWCEMPRCIGWHRDPASAGFRDARGRAHAAGWRTDALGRLACPDCQQTRADYRTPQPLTWHHPTVARRWHEHGQLPSDDALFRLGVEAEYGKQLTWNDYTLACAIGDATHRTAAS